MNPNNCPFFKPTATAAWICASWWTPLVGEGEPFCAAGLECDTQGSKITADAALIKRVGQMDVEEEG